MEAGADFLQDQVAGHFKQDVADKKQSGTESVHRFAKSERIEHLQLGNAHIHAIQKCGKEA